jgi:hypothetical protein
MSILDNDTCTCAFDAAAAKEANEIGAERVRVILSLSPSLSLSPHQHSVRNDGLGSAACRSCRGRRRWMCILRPSMNVRPLSFDAHPSRCRRWMYVLCLSVNECPSRCRRWWMYVISRSMHVHPAVVDECTSSVCARVSVCQWMCVLLSSMNVRSSVCHRWMCVPGVKSSMNVQSSVVDKCASRYHGWTYITFGASSSMNVG